MATKVLKDVLRKVESWPEEAQQELAAIAREMDEELRGGVYHASREELAGIDRGLEAARQGRFATDEEIAAVFFKKRRS